MRKCMEGESLAHKKYYSLFISNSIFIIVSITATINSYQGILYELRFWFQWQIKNPQRLLGILNSPKYNLIWPNFIVWHGPSNWLFSTRSYFWLIGWSLYTAVVLISIVFIFSLYWHLSSGLSWITCSKKPVSGASPIFLLSVRFAEVNTRERDVLVTALGWTGRLSACLKGSSGN